MTPVELDHDGTHLRGYAALPDSPGPSPAVLVMHSALGIAYERNEITARKLADLGCVAVCTDMYGAEHEGVSANDAGRAYADILATPEVQRARTVAWFEHVASRPDVDATRVAAIGFCYGGMTALELARSGADVKAVVSYHGTLGTHARAEPGVVRAHVVAYCGSDDPFAPLADVDALRHELIDARVHDYQITVFGGVAHGFTDPGSAALGIDGVEYDELAQELSWRGTLALLEHVFR
jgi:dienelactone hydrolase